MGWFWDTEKWGHVKEFKVPHRYDYKDGYIYIHLYESATSNRKVEFGSTHKKLTDKEAKEEAIKSEIYHERVVRWLGGRHDIEIPRYTERAEDDTVNALKGVVK